MTTDTSKLVPYVPSAYPSVPDGEKSYFTTELRNISQAIKSIEEILANVSAGTAVYLAKASNLSDVAVPATARTNLGPGSAALLASASVFQPANNLSEVVTPATARVNLGLGSVSTHALTDLLQTANNLSDVTAATARTNLVAATKTQTEFVSANLGNATLSNSTYNIIEKIPYGVTLTGFTVKLVSGTITATLNINGVNVTNGALNATSTQQSTTPSALNVMNANDTLTITLSANAAALLLSYTVSYTRVLA